MASSKHSDGGRRASLRDVAQLAGVSTGTVSRALSRPGMLSETTRARVLRAVEQLDYVADGSARSLAARRTMTVGAIVPRIGTSQFTIMIEALESQLAREGYTLLLSAPSHDESREPAILRTLLSRGVDGVALLGSDHPEATFSLLMSQRRPYVLMWGQAGRHKEVVTFNEQEAASLAVDHLHALGHRAVAFIGGHTGRNERARVRQEAVLRAVRARSITVPDGALVETDYGFREGYDAMTRLLGRQRHFSAALLGNDYLAAGALAALAEAGIQVPKSLSIVGFNDNDFSAFLYPPLTTIRLPIAQIGREAARYLVAALGNSPEPAPDSLPVELIERASSGPPRSLL